MFTIKTNMRTSSWVLLVGQLAEHLVNLPCRPDRTWQADHSALVIMNYFLSWLTGRKSQDNQRSVSNEFHDKEIYQSKRRSLIIQTHQRYLLSSYCQLFTISSETTLKQSIDKNFLVPSSQFWRIDKLYWEDCRLWSLL